MSHIATLAPSYQHRLTKGDLSNIWGLCSPLPGLQTLWSTMCQKSLSGRGHCTEVIMTIDEDPRWWQRRKLKMEGKKNAKNESKLPCEARDRQQLPPSHMRFRLNDRIWGGGRRKTMTIQMADWRVTRSPFYSYFRTCLPVLPKERKRKGPSAMAMPKMTQTHDFPQARPTRLVSTPNSNPPG